MGTWGDASAKYSNGQSFYSAFGDFRILSDSYLSHLLVEQGINLAWLMLSIICVFKLLKKGISNNLNIVNALSILGIHILWFVIIASTKSMGLSLFENSFFIYFLLGFILGRIDMLEN